MKGIAPRWVAITLVSCVGVLAAAAAQKRLAPPAASVLSEDKGKFRILLDGQVVGGEEFEISRAGTDWIARATTDLHPPGSAPARVTGKLQLGPDGAPAHYEWSAQTQKKASATIEFQNGVAKMALVFEGAQPFLQELSFGTPRVVVLDNNLYHQYAILARLYDWNARGAQSFPVLIPQELTPGNISVESRGPQEVAGAALELLRVRTADIEVNLYLDSSHRLMRLSVAASKVEVVRE